MPLPYIHFVRRLDSWSLQLVFLLALLSHAVLDLDLHTSLERSESNAIFYIVFRYVCFGTLRVLYALCVSQGYFYLFKFKSNDVLKGQSDMSAGASEGQVWSTEGNGGVEGCLSLASRENSKEEEGDTEEQDVLDAPFVVQCKHCRTIVCDSWSFISASRDDATLTVSKASNVSVASQEVQMADLQEKRGSSSSSVQDQRREFTHGCTFRELLCSNCGHKLGRVYHATPRRLDARRGLFTFDHAAITSYRLGAAQFDASDNGGEDDNGAAAVVGATERMGNELSSMKTDLCNIKRLMLLFNERIAAIEHERGSGVVGGGAAHADAGRNGTANGHF